MHPAVVDPTWRPDTYRYRNEKLEIIWTTSALLSDEAAFDFFSVVKDFGPAFTPIYVEVRRAGTNYKSWKLLPVKYYPDTNEVEYLEVENASSD